MLNETPLVRLIALITFDRNYEKISIRIASLEKEIALLHSQEQELANTLTTAQQLMLSIKKEIDTYDLSVKELDEQIQKKKELLAAAMSPREHRAIMAEIDALNTRQLQREEQLLTAWNTLDTRKRLYEKLAQTNEQHIRDIKTAITEKENEISAEKVLLTEGAKQRATYQQGLPAQWLEKYAAMRCRVPNPIVPIEQGSCSACFHSVSEQELVQLRRQALLQCKGCYRFLYCPTAHQIQS